MLKTYITPLVFFFGWCFPFVTMAQKHASKEGFKNCFEYVKDGFANPDKQYGSAPLWVWHTKVTNSLIDSMLYDFKKNSFGGVFIHPRPGLITEYLSEDWYQLYKHAVTVGKELGLNVWIYDEDSYPTGFAGGLVPYQMPESYNQGQMLHLNKGSKLPDTTDRIFICLKENEEGYEDVTSRMNEVKSKEGKYYWFTKEYYGKQAGMVGPPEFPYVDLMAKGVTGKFIDITLEGYKKRFGNEFGKAIQGYFSDEPSIPAQGAGNIRWTPDLFDVFKQKWGYDLQTNLPSLFEETGDWRKVRHDYRAALLQLFIDRWSKPMQTFAEQNNLKWTGHYWEHGWPDPEEGPDNMAMYAWPQYPGIDMLFNQFNEVSPNAQFGNIRSVKELSSVANQLNKDRTLCETYGGGGWELTFKDMKRLGDWEFVLGVNFLNQHLSMMTLTGARKYDYPQSFSYHSPWWPYYKTLNRYFGRLSFALSQGQQKNDILILEPTTSAWMYAVHGKNHNHLSEIGNSFQSFITRLEKAQVEFDLGSEEIIKDHGKTVNGKYVVGQRAYSTVVIPPGMENIDLPTFQLLRSFAEQGGKIIMFEKLQRLDGAENPGLMSFAKTCRGVIQLEKLDERAIEEHFQSREFRIMNVDADSIGGNLYHQRRQLKDGQMVFLSNASMELPAKGELQIKGEEALLMDLFSGKIFDYSHRKKGETVLVDFDIPAAGSLMLFIGNKKHNSFVPYSLPEKEVKIKTSSLKVMRPPENTLMIDFCDLQINGKDSVMKDLHVGLASKTVFRQYGFSKDPWDHQMQFKDHIMARDTFSKGTGFIVTYRFFIDAKANFKEFRAVIEQGGLWSQIRMNGETVHPAKDRWWLDRSFSVLDVGNLLRPGENILQLTVNPMSVFAEIEPVYILGNFNLASAEKGWVITAPHPLRLGSWKLQGLPLYGQSISYEKKCFLKGLDRQYEVQLGQWKGTVVRVKVNGVQAGIIISEPNKLNITPYLRKGSNQIEVEVVGSLKNLLGPHHNAPKPGLVGPGHWGNIKAYPPGRSYDTYDYGLFDDFEVMAGKKQQAKQKRSFSIGQAAF